MADQVPASEMLPDEQIQYMSIHDDRCAVSKVRIPMRAKRLLWPILILILVLTACVNDKATIPPPTALEPTDTPASVTTGTSPSSPIRPSISYRGCLLSAGFASGEEDASMVMRRLV